MAQSTRGGAEITAKQPDAYQCVLGRQVRSKRGFDRNYFLHVGQSFALSLYSACIIEWLPTRERRSAQNSSRGEDKSTKGKTSHVKQTQPEAVIEKTRTVQKDKSWDKRQP